jgi:hypothetical protein
MARFPIIDDPCPLGQDELAGIAGHCRRCGKTVHSLDAMDDAERSSFMSQAKGSICVLYRLPMRIGAALAISLAAPAFGQDCPTAESSVEMTVAPGETGVVGGAPVGRLAGQQIVVTGGTVREPANAQWIEDLSLPELPTAPDDSAASK